MAQSAAQVRRDVELTRERMSDTITQLERKLNVGEVVRNNPLPSLAIAVGVGFLLSRTATRSASVKVGTAIAGGAARASVGGMLNGVAERLFGGVADVLGKRVDGWVDDLRQVVVPSPAPAETNGRHVERFADDREHARGR